MLSPTRIVSYLTLIVLGFLNLFAYLYEKYPEIVGWLRSRKLAKVAQRRQ